LATCHKKGKDMKNVRRFEMAKPGPARRLTWTSTLLAAVLGAVACNTDAPPAASMHHDDAAAKNDAGATGGSGGGTGGKGGTAGSPSGGSGGNAGAGGSGGKGGGAGGDTSGGASGSSAGGAGAGGTSTKGGAGGGAGSGGSGGGSSDAAPDSARSDAASDVAPTRDGNRDTLGKSDGADSACPAKQTLCDGTCVDTSTSTSNCGGCGSTFACGANQVCSGGSCVGTTPNDGCTDTLASNLTVQQIAVYQSIKIPIMNAGSEVAAASRISAVVNGRPSVVRVFVTPGSGWSAHDVSARLTLVPSGGEATVYTSKKTISAASTDADTKSTFQFNIPAEAMSTPMSYSLEIVECGTASGTAGNARFPSTGTIDMGVKTTGVIKVKIIPLKANSLLPDTSETALAPYAAHMKAMYPITDISFSIGDTLTVASVEDWSGTLDQVRAKRSADKPANDVYYYGLIKPAADLKTYCKSSCITGIGYVVDTATGSYAGSARAAMGIGFGDKASTETMNHEIGHNHGRNHAPCSTAGTITGVDSSYPYSKAAVGVWGYDSRSQTLIDPAKYVDIMSYCSPVWISDYNYKALITRVAAVNGVANVLTVNAEMAKWRVILVDDERGPRWGIPLDEPGPAEGQPEMATIYDDNGDVLTSVRVYRTEIGDVSAAMYMVPEPKQGWYAIAVDGAGPLPFAAPMPRL
jgi:hypothetical protein